MCGIFGYNVKKDKNLENIFFESLKHRGPDAQITLNTDVWSLGHLRLSIIDTNESANQPMESTNGVLVFNGEIYNFIELKNEYLKDIKFKTKSDTEVLLALLDKYGVTILNKLNGMFALSYLDKNTGNITLCRDRFGVKPLHYTKNNDELYFSSEIKPLIKIRKNISFNEKIISTFLKETTTDFDEDTFINEIKQVEAGYLIEIDPYGKILRKKQWYKGNDFVFDKNIFKNHTSTINFFEELLIDSLKLRHRSDVPVCITLSGGLDSSTLYVLAKEKLNSKIQPFTLSHPGSDTDELHKAKLLAESYNDQILVVTNKENEGVDKIIQSLKFLEFPIWNMVGPAFIDTYQSVNQHKFKVVIEGHGSDEQLGGYPHQIDSAWKEMFLKLNIKRAFHIYNIYQETSNPTLQQYNKKNKTTTIIFFSMIFDFFLTILREIKNPKSQNFFMQKTLNKDFEYKILPIVLRTFDRMSMSQSVESRCPFMDYRIVEFTKKMPIKFKVNEIGSKAPLREILKKYNKDYIYKDKKKMGWSTDVVKLINNTDVKKFLKKHIEKFDDNKFYNLKKEALNKVSKEKIEWKDASVIWKIASISIIKDLYGIRK